MSRSNHFDQVIPETGLYHRDEERDACGVGFVCNLDGHADRRNVEDGLMILCRLEHRGGRGRNPNEGDGAGIIMGMPFKFMAECARTMFPHAEPLEMGKFAAGNVFFVRDEAIIARCIAAVVEVFEMIGLEIIGWRPVPTDNSVIGPVAKQSEPEVRQLFVRCPESLSQDQFERRLYWAQKAASHRVNAPEALSDMYFCSLSSKTIVYKGQLTCEQLPHYYVDLANRTMKTHVAAVHSRFSTNTLPSWSKAHPFRYVCHNGEINTRQGNINWMRAREGLLKSPFAEDVDFSTMGSIVEQAGSDSQSLDNVLQMLHIGGGLSLPESVLMMMPEAWQNSQIMDPDRKAMFKFLSSQMEPWDGPALVLFTNGDVIGATLDRNGLRPCRYYVTTQDRVICSSEVGVLPTIQPLHIKEKGRLKPGRMLLGDFKQGKILNDDELKGRWARRHPYREWIERNQFMTTDIQPPVLSQKESFDPTSSDSGSQWTSQALQLFAVFGYTDEHLEMLLAPMAQRGEEALGSMGNDAALACLSDLPRLTFDYFKQLFAQVTNPPIDPIREYVVMSLASFVGPEPNLLSISEEHVQRLWMEHPVLTVDEMKRLKDGSLPHQWKSLVIDTTYLREKGASGLEDEIRRVCDEAAQGIRDGYQLIILSDRKVGPGRVPMAVLPTAGAVHHHLVTLEMRTLTGLIVESGEPREVHHHCLLFGFGVDAVCPYMAFAAINMLVALDKFEATKPIERSQLYANYISAVEKGIKKVMAKIGVSTLQSYRGSQTFEAVGLAPEIMDVCFKRCASRIGGIGFQGLGRDYLALHKRGFPAIAGREPTTLTNLGEYHWRQGAGKEAHINLPEAVTQLQLSARTNSRAAYKQFSDMHWKMVQKTTIRGQLQFVTEGITPIDISEVEDPKMIVKRFRTGAMSYGSISQEAHTAMAVAMNAVGAKSNSGEGGEDAERWIVEGETNARSAIKQVASGRFGVTIEYLASAKELQIKMAQGAKPGEGGELPGWKVSESIAKTRHSTPGVGLISPPPHHDIYSIEDLAQLIFDLKNANPSANISVKLVSKVGVGVIAAGVAKCKADHILISGHDGGTGASKWTGIKHAGLPWELGIAETHQVLVANGLRGRVSLETDGHIRTGREIVIAALLGAEEFGMGTAPLISLGCIMMRKCHLNTCPVGIATQDPELRAKFEGKPEHLINYLFLIAEEVREILASLGLRSLEEAVGRTDLLTSRHLPGDSSKAASLDLSRLLAKPTCSVGEVESHKLYPQVLDLSQVLDNHLIEMVKESAFALIPCRVNLNIENKHRSVGTMLSHEIVKMHTDSSLRPTAVIPEDLIHCFFTGSAGQSFAAFLASGITMELVGDTNDYCGKGLSGGDIIMYPHPNAKFVAEEQIIVGNVALYGATSGRAFFRGKAAERFAVRNSGALAVVEGVGDHCCEYMTGGRVVVLGETGINFGAGMSGGIAFVYDPHKNFPIRCNKSQVELERVDPLSTHAADLLRLVTLHCRHTGSVVARSLLSKWRQSLEDFVMVFPVDYKRALADKAMKKPASVVPVYQPPVVPSGKDIEDLMLTPSSPQLAKKKADSLRARASGGDMSETELRQIEEERRIVEKKKQDKIGAAPASKQRRERPVIVAEPIKTRGFLAYERGAAPYRAVQARVADFEEVYTPRDEPKLKTQAARCMDCGVPFCQSAPGCPLGNRIPTWNNLIYKNQWKEALDQLLATNNFPEWTGRVCPAPCEGSCTLGIIDNPVTIKNIECAIIDRAFEEGWIVASPPEIRTGLSVAIVGSGPAGCAAADQLNKLGHLVTVYERADRAGGLMMYGVPNMKADKTGIVQRRIQLMQEEGVKFICGAQGNVSDTQWLLSGGTPSPSPDADAPSITNLLATHDAVLLATGATMARDLPIPGRQLKGVHFAMEFLHRNTKALVDGGNVGPEWLKAVPKDPEWINVHGKRVIVIGGGDTGNDCIGTSMRMGAKSVVNFELLPRPPPTRGPENPWPQWPRIFRVDYGHEEVEKSHGKDPREYCILSKEFIGDADGNLTGVRTVRVEWTQDESGRHKFNEVPGSEAVYEADYVFLAMGFLGPDKTLASELSLTLDPRGNFQTDTSTFMTSVDKVFACGDCRRGQSLVVWAISEGRKAADCVDKFLLEKIPENPPVNV